MIWACAALACWDTGTQGCTQPAPVGAAAVCSDRTVSPASSVRQNHSRVRASKLQNSNLRSNGR